MTAHSITVFIHVALGSLALATFWATDPYAGSPTEVYKQDVGAGSDSGSFASSYTTAFFNTPGDPMDATITYVGAPAPAITTDPVYLLVKDGNATPAWYLFNISNWNGTESIVMTNFWPAGGAISHVALQVGDRQLAAMIQLIDSRHEPSREDREMVRWLQEEGMRYCIVATKFDKLRHAEKEPALRTISEWLALPHDQPVIPYSSHTGEGRGALLEWIGSTLEAVDEIAED